MFANLVSFNNSATSAGKNNMSLQEQQKQLAAQRAQQEAQKRAQFDAQYGGGNSQFWDNLEKTTTTPTPTPAPAPATTFSSSMIPGVSTNGRNTNPMGSSAQGSSGVVKDEEEDDILAAFNSAAPVDSSTNFPVPSSTASPAPTSRVPSNAQQNQNSSSMNMFDDDDDPFGLRQMSAKPTPNNTTAPPPDDDDDILGPLAKPVSQFPKESRSKEKLSEPASAKSASPAPPPSPPALDKPLADLVDMGFPIDKSRDALAATESGTDVQAAVGWLLNQAHTESQQKSRARSRRPIEEQHRSESRGQRSVSRPSRQRDQQHVPTWMRDQERSGSGMNDRSVSRGRATAEKDAAQVATEFGNNLFKSANSLWKTGTKKVQQAVHDFNAPPDPNQPRWLREGAIDSEFADSVRDDTARRRDKGRHVQESRPKESPIDFTNEAMMLEAQKPELRKPSRPEEGLRRTSSRQDDLRDSSPALPARQPRLSPQMKFQQEVQNQSRHNKSRPNRFEAEDQAAQAYVSPARRRRKPAPSTPAPSAPASESQPDLLESSLAAPKPTRPASTSPLASSRTTTKSSTPLQIRPKVVQRSIPQVAPEALGSSNQYRQQGSEAYKKGDYTSAHASYSKALSLLPEKHPITYILLSNRALTALKIGEPKSAITDADIAITSIGPGKGESEKIELGNGEPDKDMREIFGKALMRKAEALEQLERYGDAAKAWQEAVESGHGGSTSIEGRNRCEKASGLKKPTPRPSVPASTGRRPPTSSSSQAQTKKPPHAPQRPVVEPAKSFEAVNRLRAANDAADRADSEKLALSDSVDARLNNWKGGKQDNLRALLGSLDTVLWPEAGWKKISMAELVMPNKVKIQYMKGISKVHPDKVSLIRI